MSAADLRARAAALRAAADEADTAAARLHLAATTTIGEQAWSGPAATVVRDRVLHGPGAAVVRARDASRCLRLTADAWEAEATALEAAAARAAVADGDRVGVPTTAAPTPAPVPEVVR